MKPILLIIAIALTAILAGCHPHFCDAPTCSDPRWDCCDGNTCVRYVQDQVDVTSEYTVGKICVGTNTQADFTIHQDLSNVVISGSSPPQEQDNVTKCMPAEEGSYTVIFLGKTGHLNPDPKSDVSVRKGMRAIIYGYYSPL